MMETLLRWAPQTKDRQQTEMTPTISIIDDDEFVREATKSLVRSLGYAAATFSSAGEYLRSDSIWQSSCLITDLQMPEMSGVELQRRLTTDGNDTPIIFMTADSDDKTRSQALNAGAIGFLRKPFDADILIECLDRALRLKAA